MRLIYLPILLLCLAPLFLSACAGRAHESQDASESQVKVRGQYDVTLGTRK